MSVTKKELIDFLDFATSQKGEHLFGELADLYIKNQKPQMECNCDWLHYTWELDENTCFNCGGWIYKHKPKYGDVDSNILHKTLNK